jgi:hypothetical protein
MITSLYVYVYKERGLRIFFRVNTLSSLGNGSKWDEGIKALGITLIGDNVSNYNSQIIKTS